MTLQCIHDVRSGDFRWPSGPVPVETDVLFRLFVSGEDRPLVDSVRLFYVYGLESFTEGHVLMTTDADFCSEGAGDAGTFYVCRCPMSDAPGLFYYWFEIRLTDSRYFWCFPDERTCGLTGCTLDHSLAFSTGGSEPIPGFQITVHTRDFRTPDWMKGAVMYQIFPDRFCRGRSFDEQKVLPHIEERPERLWHSAWEEDVDIKGKPPFGYLACDFFGGTLDGIREALPGLASRGVTVLYLNPVYQSCSNHRYDTGDYLKVDPVLGGNKSLAALCESSGALGIRVILDIALSHTGADSRYFNRFSRYDSPGAFQAQCGGAHSPYLSWYRFLPDASKNAARVSLESASGVIRDVCYDAWWGFASLPNVNEDDLTYGAFILGPNGVLAHWLRAGCSGFRLDVSDELPDTFLRRLRKCVKREKPDAYVVGEVWEEPTAKISYGHHRDFLFGRTHDAVMGYCFRREVLAYLKGASSGEHLARMFQKFQAITPAEALYVQMNLLGSHDTERVITLLAGDPKPDSRSGQKNHFLSAAQRRRGESLVALAFLLQCAFPGVMAVYYGDEIGMDGYDDPFNRRTYPSEAARLLSEAELTDQDPARDAPDSQTFFFVQDILNGSDPDMERLARAEGKKNRLHTYSYRLMTLFQRLSVLRRDTPVLRTGYFDILYADRDVIVIRRFLDDSRRDAFGAHVDGPSSAVIAINRSDLPQQIALQDVPISLLSPRDGVVFFQN